MVAGAIVGMMVSGELVVIRTMLVAGAIVGTIVSSVAGAVW